MSDPPRFTEAGVCSECGGERRIAELQSDRKLCIDCHPAVENPWDFGVLLSSDGAILPRGACEGYHQKRNQHDPLGK